MGSRHLGRPYKFNCGAGHVDDCKRDEVSLQSRRIPTTGKNDDENHIECCTESTKGRSHTGGISRPLQRRWRPRCQHNFAQLSESGSNFTCIGCDDAKPRLQPGAHSSDRKTCWHQWRRNKFLKWGGTRLAQRAGNFLSCSSVFLSKWMNDKNVYTP